MESITSISSSVSTQSSTAVREGANVAESLSRIENAVGVPVGLPVKSPNDEPIPMGYALDRNGDFIIPEKPLFLVPKSWFSLKEQEPINI